MADVHLLKSFLAVYRAGSISRAAGVLHLTQPAISLHIRSMEDAVGRTLFMRKPRGMEPTPVGHELARLVAGPMDALSAAMASTSVGTMELGGVVVLGGPAAFLSELIIPAVSGGPEGLRFHFQLGLANPLLEALHRSELDFVISTVRVSAHAFETLKLFREEFVLVGAPRWAEPLRGLDFKSSDVLDSVPWVSYADDLPIIRRFFRKVLGRRHNATAHLVVPDLRAVLLATMAGAGVTVLPRYLARTALAQGQLVEIMPCDDPPSNDIYLVWRSGSLAAPRLQYVKERIVQAAAGW